MLLSQLRVFDSDITHRKVQYIFILLEDSKSFKAFWTRRVSFPHPTVITQGQHARGKTDLTTVFLRRKSVADPESLQSNTQSLSDATK